ncbi:MAG: ATP-binding protein [Candidatus Woesearchaeota archaeon]
MSKLTLDEIVERCTDKIVCENISKIPEVVRMLENYASGLRLIPIVVPEIITNAIHHGNREDPRKKVWVYILKTEQELYVAVQDEGEGFDFQEGLKKYDTPHGLKLVTYAFDEAYNDGNAIIMRKSLIG